MPDPKNLLIQEYNYPLPEERIARYPLLQRDGSKLLIYREGKISEDIYRNIGEHLPTGSLLLFNNTRVIEARLLFQKPTGGIIELFCLEPGQQYSDINTAMQQIGKVYWHCMIGGASKWKHGQVLKKIIGDVSLSATYISKTSDSFLIEFSWTPSRLSFAEILHAAGAMPLPPYLKRNAEDLDKERYQTIYASPEGSVAAPTAGLHFTERIFEELKKKNIQKEFLTLHVGAGTFKPVKTETIAGHQMHYEQFEINKTTLDIIINNLNGNIIPVGTTTLRALESLYWLGIKIRQGAKSLEVHQWDPYELETGGIHVEESLFSLRNLLREENKQSLIANTSILVAPGYEFRLAKGLVTNFHQPQSTLLLLIAAFIGEDWKKVYDYALQNEFRFLSYGDGCLLFGKVDKLKG